MIYPKLMVILGLAMVALSAPKSTPYTYTPYTPVQPLDVTKLTDRITLEELQRKGQKVLQDEKDSLKIVEGANVTSPTKFPWMAAVWYNYYGKHYFMCSASIISRSKILTALHCALESYGELNSPSDYIVTVGSNYMFSAHQYKVKSFTIPSFDVEIGIPVPDYVILNLEEKLPKGQPNIKPICLAPSPAEDPDTGAQVIAMGWGQTSNYGEPSLILKQAKLSVVQESVCANYYGDVTLGLVANFFCATWLNGGICSGDSGGPVVIKRKNKYFQIGVNSFGGEECSEDIPMGFASTRTATFIDVAAPFRSCKF